jgi:YVTN family beta-propeller protein
MRGFAVVILCALACAPAAAKDTGLIFVSNEKTNNIIVIDPKTYKVVNDIKVARRPRDMHFNADHTKLYIACGDDDVIDILDVAKQQVIGRLKTGPSPEAFGMDEKRSRIYVSDEEGSSLSVIDMDRNIIVQEVPTGAEPEGVLVSEDGKTVYVTSEAGDLVHAIDAATGKVVRDVVAGLRPRRIAATPDGKALWVTAELAGEVDIIDRAKFVVTGSIAFLPPLALSVRPWDHQVRQAILLAAPHSVVADAPIEGFLHRTNQLDTLGDDEPESACHLNR